MLKEFNFFQLFDQFITESKSGKRLKKDGTKIRLGTTSFYTIVQKELKEFTSKEGYGLRIRDVQKVGARALKSEKLFWKRFHRRYADYLYSKGCYDNYVGAHFKVLRTFFNYLKNEKNIYTGDFHKILYVRNENIPITVLSREQLHFLIWNKEFEKTLPLYLKKTKDVFVFGCTVGLRFSDLMHLTKRNIEKMNGSTYLRVRSQKTSTDTRIKLPTYAIEIIMKYGGPKSLLPTVSNNRLNLNLKELCQLAGWDYEIGKQREQRGMIKRISRNGKNYRFCDLVTTHTMRRTAITTLLSQGMPEIMVRKISGHSAYSKEFYRYVNYAQKQIDDEVDRIFSSLNLLQNLAEISA